MKELRADLFECAGPNDAICVTTNGMVKNDGRAVMGAGVAKEAVRRYPLIDYNLAKHLAHYGNHVGLIFEKPRVYSFPTKHHWRDDSDIELIKRSAHELVDLTFNQPYDRIFIPRPGCQNGRLNWEDVKAVLEPILVWDRFVVVNKI